MKRITFMWILLLIAIVTKAQQEFPIDNSTNRIKFTKVVESPGVNQKQIIEASRKWFDNKVLFYRASAHAKPKKAYRQFTKGTKGNPKPEGLITSTDSVHIGRCLFVFNGRKSEYFNLMGVTADVVVSCKEGRSRIMITNYDYYYMLSGKGIGLEMNDRHFAGCSGWTGQFEIVKNCNVHETTYKKLHNFIYSSSQELIESYEQSMKNAATTTNSLTQDW